MGKGGGGSTPDYAAQAIEGQNAQLDTFPLQYLTNAASAAGGKFTLDGKTYDFAGLGNADVSGQVSDKLAQTLLDIQKGLAPQYIAERLKELQQADPQGYAARQDLFDRIMAQAKAHPDRPLAEDLQKQVQAELDKGGKLNAKQVENVQEGVRGKQVGNGIFLGNAATGEEAKAVLDAGDAQRNARQQAALTFQQSGVSPEDVEYRRIQQNMANLSDFIQGRTPTAQFQQLSGAQSGAVPFSAPNYSPTTVNPNGAQYGVKNAGDIYSAQNNWAQSQANPFLAGASMGLNAYNAYQAYKGHSPSTAWNPATSPSVSYFVNNGVPGGPLSMEIWQAFGGAPQP